MAQYNLIDIGTIGSSTVSGTGNKALSVDELRLLYDNNTTTSGIVLGPSDVLYLDIDIGYRIKMDDIKLFISVSGDREVALTNVDFYYKNDELDSFTLCAKEQDSTTFYPIDTPDLFAPRYFRVVINNIQADIYELQLMNDDTQVSFGTSGNDTLVLVDQLNGGYTSLGIFNNSDIDTDPVTAYVIVDYQRNASDFYIKLASSFDGEYYGLNDGLILQDNDLTSIVRWNNGIFNNTMVYPENESIITTNYEIGYYTTPIFSIGDVFEATFLLSDVTTISGSSITWDEAAPSGTIKVRSSNTSPLSFTKLFWLHKRSDNRIVILEGDMTTGNKIDTKKDCFDGSTRYTPKRVIFDRERAHYIVLCKYQYSSTLEWRLRKYDYNTGTNLYSSTSSTFNDISTNMDVDKQGNVWGSATGNRYSLVCFNYTLATRTTIRTEDLAFVTDLSANKISSSCWYTDNEKSQVSHVASDGSVMTSFSMASPTYICSILDGGCFVVNASEAVIVRFDINGDQLSYFHFDAEKTINAISYGFNSANVLFNIERLWLIINASYVVQLDFSGREITETIVPSPTGIEAFPGGCLVYSSYNHITYQLDTNGEIVRIWNFSSYPTKGGMPFPVIIDYNEFLTMEEIGNILPVSHDPYWGTDLNWVEVVRSGYKLPHKKYHQAMFKIFPQMCKLPLINPDAETGDITGWDKNYSRYGDDDFKAVTSPIWEGQYVFSMIPLSTIFNYYVYQKIDIQSIDIDYEEQEREKLEFYFRYVMKASNTYQNYLIIKVVQQNQGYDDIKTTTSAEHSHTNWQTHYLKDTILSETKYIEIRLGGNHYYNNNFIYLDAMEIYIFRSPTLNRVVIPKPIKITELRPQEYKNIYIKTEFPEEAAYTEYETRLRCWWGNEEEN